MNELIGKHLQIKENPKGLNKQWLFETVDDGWIFQKRGDIVLIVKKIIRGSSDDCYEALSSCGTLFYIRDLEITSRKID